LDLQLPSVSAATVSHGLGLIVVSGLGSVGAEVDAGALVLVSAVERKVKLINLGNNNDAHDAQGT